MSQPNFPSLSPSITREDALNMILFSIALEELGLSHIINTEGEKIQFVLGTLPGLSGRIPNVQDVITINNSVRNLIDTISQNQLILRAKLETVLSSPASVGETGPIGPIGLVGPSEGLTGPTGSIGITGPTGNNGPSGSIGPSGVIGATGESGFSGATGAIGITGSNGSIGATGVTGNIGFTGSSGSTGPLGPNPTAISAFAANTTGSSITVILAGTLIALPNAQVTSSNITINGANTVFTINTAGLYRISYIINTTAALLLGSRLIINGSPNTASTIAVGLSTSNFRNEININLGAGSTVSLQLFGLLGTAVLLNSSAGASLMIVRII
ncbi:collagen triple helix repeat [Clostridium puniceum]|uniref:Collagen triple helix repeat n=1 Tax=Clostridium puniceum TaxID=29367 RepID=A0A1S8TXP7_9CLOT|nr:collagen-like protein [Clostridium puniceum]OOM82498.1 collagen triple helix repeat [Clostridium puniceum]